MSTSKNWQVRSWKLGISQGTGTTAGLAVISAGPFFAGALLGGQNPSHGPVKNAEFPCEIIEMVILQSDSIWGFPKMGVPPIPNSSIWMGFSTLNPPEIGYPPSLKSARSPVPWFPHLQLFEDKSQFSSHELHHHDLLQGRWASVGYFWRCQRF